MVTRLTDMLRHCLPQQDSWQLYLLQNWNDIMGELHTRVCLERIDGETIILGVHDVHWMQELFCLGQELVAHINARLAQQHIKKIRFVLSKSRHQQKKYNKPTRAPLRNKTARIDASHLLTEQQRKALSAITDLQLQDLMRKFMIRGSS